MMGKAFVVGLLIAAALAAPAAAQQADDDILSKIVNAPSPDSFQVDGLRAKPKVRKDETVQGGKALRIAVPGKDEKAWTVAASSPVQKPVKAGDQLILAFWARAEKAPDGAAAITLPFNGVQLAASPWSPVFSGAAEVGPEWKLHEVKGKADKDYGAGELRVTLHLATGKQTVDLGPVFLLNMGR